jgi:hypothetical protein
MTVSDVIAGYPPGQQLLRPAKLGRERPAWRLLGEVPPQRSIIVE